MFKKVIPTTLAVSAIVISTSLVEAKESYSQNSTQSNTVFVCATKTEPPTLFAYTPGQVNLTPLMSWHQDYLLPDGSGVEICQRVATKLQNLLQQQEPIFFVTEQKEDRNLLCLVKQESSNCHSENSEELFSVKPYYDATCVVDNREPLECLAINRSRGVLGVPQSAYTPTWKFWSW